MDAPALSHSEAFRQASLRSETRRAQVVIVLALLMMCLAILPSSQTGVDIRVRFTGLAGVIVLIAVHAGLLLLARRARLTHTAIPPALMTTAVVIESLIPTTILFWLVHHALLTPWAALGAPPVFAYGVILTLSTLRLRPLYCVLSGVLCAGGYFGLYQYVRHGLHAQRALDGLPYGAYINASILLLLAGIAAAWVARELRRHLEAALNEAQTRNQLARLENDLAVARTIQQALLPRATPTIPGYEIAGWNRSADQTGGDYYDWQPLDGGAWLVTLADVSGHGIGPALVTAACRAYMRAGSRYHPDLGDLTARINQLLADDLPEGRFITLAGVRIDPSGPVHLLSAGHGPIVLYISSSGEMRDLLPSDIPLAISPGATFGPAQPVDLAPGDMIALVTDGFVEWARAEKPGAPREDFGLSRLRDALKRHAHLPADQIIQAVAKEAEAYAQGQPQQDDLTMVIIRRLSS